MYVYLRRKRIWFLRLKNGLNHLWPFSLRSVAGLKKNIDVCHYEKIWLGIWVWGAHLQPKSI